MKLEHILVATDLSEHARDAFPHAACLAERFGARITLLNVVEPFDLSFLPTHSLVDIAQERTEVARAGLEREGAWFGQRGQAVSLRTTAGAAAEAIIRFVEGEAVDCVVLTRHGADRSEHFFVGATARRVLRHLQVPLLLVPPTDQATAHAFAGYQHILVATDYGDDSRHGLAAALDLAERFAARITLTHVVKLPSELVGGVEGVGAQLPEHTVDWLQEHHRTELTKLAEAATDRVAVEGRVALDASPAAGLAATAETVRADMIVVPSHGKGAFRAILLGSTSERLLNLSHVPVLVLPRGWLDARS